MGPTCGGKGQMQLSLGVPVLEEAELQKPQCRKCLEAPLEPPKLDPGRSLGLPLGHFAQIEPTPSQVL